jgi:hypothetical protein
MEAAAVVVFSTWLLVTMLFQIDRVGWTHWLKRHDYFAMIPVWTFFAPNPGTTDIHLLYRDRLTDGAVTRWKEVPLHTSFLRVFWNPQKRFQKGLLDLSDDLRRHALNHVQRAEFILLHTGFIALLTFVTRQPHAPFATFTQFVIARSFGYHAETEAEVMFLSNFHRI